MQNNKIFLFGLSLLLLSGCSGKTETPAAASSSAPTVSASSVTAVSDETPVSVNENITTSSNYIEEPAPAAAAGTAEGYVPEDIPEGTLKQAEQKQEVQFTEKGSPAYSVTIDNAAFTDRRSVIPGDQTEKVLLITYTYRSLNGEPRLVDDMSFRLFAGETAAESYNVADQITGDISTDAPVTAEVCFSVPADASEFTLFVVDNAEEGNENYSLYITL